MTKLCITLFALASLASSVQGVEIRVQRGESVHLALRQAREMRRLHQVEDKDTLFITLEDGRYPMSEPLFVRSEDSGTPQSPTVIRAANPGKAVLDGGIELKGWRRPTQDEVRNVPEYAQDKVWVCDAPRVHGRILSTRQLWMGDKRLPPASLAPEGMMIPMTDFKPDQQEIWVDAANLRNITSPLGKMNAVDGAVMMVHQRWATALLRIKEVRREGEMVKFSFLDPESHCEFEHPWPQPVFNETLSSGRVVSSSFNLFGLVDYLDLRGEWLQRYPSGLIYFVSPEMDGSMPQTPIYIPVTERLVTVDGSAERPVHDVYFEGIGFEHTSWTTPYREGWVTLQAGFPIIDAYKLSVPGLPEKSSLENQAWIGRPQSALTLRHVQRIGFDRCQFRQMGACGVDYVEASAMCSIRDCLFEDMGATAILVGHFPSGGFETHVPFSPVNPDILCHDIRIERNQVHHVGMDDWGASAINAGYVFNTTIADNVVSDCKWSGICLGWGWTKLNSCMKNNHILRNHIYDFGMQLHDCGAVYTLSNQPGSSIVGNKFGQMGKAPYATNDRAFYIYLDEASDGFTIRDNEMPAPLIGTNQPGPHIDSDISLP